MTRDEWLAQIEANPGDWQMALIAADEIESNGDELFAEQLRFAVQWSAEEEELNITESLGTLNRNKACGKRDGWLRREERRWCEANNVRFIPAFPRSLDDVYGGRKLV